MGTLFSKKHEPIPVLALALNFTGMTTSLYRLRELGLTEGEITNVIPTIGFNQEIITVKQIGEFAPLLITSWVRPLAYHDGCSLVEKFLLPPVPL